MKVLVACEFSGIVRDSFIAKGHEAISCDLLPSDRPGPHIQGDIRDVDLTPYDLMIAFPPCTHLAVSGAWKFKDKVEEQKEALDFVQFLLDAPVKKIALENPVGIISTKIRKPDQIIQPYQFGHDASKRTCLWLKGLPKLVGTSFVPGTQRGSRVVWGNQTPSGQNKLGPSKDRWKLRSQTYQGIADAMAEQWGKE